MKSGLKTTEFWITAGSGVVALAGVLLGLTVEEKQSATAAAAKIAPALAAVAGFAVAAWRYVKGRCELKEAEQRSRSAPPDDEYDDVIR